MKKSGNDKIRVIGVYDIEEDRDVSLIELEIDIDSEKLEISRITQKVDGLPQQFYQVAYDEYYLDSEGRKVVSIKNCIPTRIAFFMSFINFKNPLQSQYGCFYLPKPKKAPLRIKNIIQYEYYE